MRHKTHEITKRVLEEAEYIIENKATVRTVAKAMSISKSTVHKDVTERLKDNDYDLYDKVRQVLDVNKQERHIRGGLATAKLYKNRGRRKKKA